MDAQQVAERSAGAMFERDNASQMLGMHIVEMAPGSAKVTMKVRADMVNGHAICHGGLIFTLCDSAFAFACNSYNQVTVAATGSIDFLIPGRLGDELMADAREIWRSGRSGIYEVTVTNQRGERVALFRGRSHRVDGQVFDTDGKQP